jgi:hypothetical protein
VLVVAEHLLQREGAVAGCCAELVDDRLPSGRHATHRSGHTGHAEDCVIGQQRAVPVEVPITGCLLELLDELQVLLGSHWSHFLSIRTSTADHHPGLGQRMPPTHADADLWEEADLARVLDARRVGPPPLETEVRAHDPCRVVAAAEAARDPG